MTGILTNQQQAQATAAQRAAATLVGVDLVARCTQLGLPAPSPNGSLTLRMLAQNLLITPPTFDAYITTTQPSANPKPAHLADRLLALHYLLCDSPIHSTGDLISFHDFPQGPFYFSSFTARTTRLLTQRFANNLNQLRSNLTRLDHQLLPALAPTQLDLAACIHIIGPLHLTLIYHAGDEEIPASAELFFDLGFKRVYNTEDVAVLSSRICLRLL